MSGREQNRTGLVRVGGTTPQTTLAAPFYEQTGSIRVSSGTPQTSLVGPFYEQTRCIRVVFSGCIDNFDRVVSGGWGESATWIGPWNLVTSGGDVFDSISVDGDWAQVTTSTPNDYHNNATMVTYIPAGIDSRTLPFEILLHSAFSWSSGSVAGEQPDLVFGLLRDDGGGIEKYVGYFDLQFGRSTGGPNNQMLLRCGFADWSSPLENYTYSATQPSTGSPFWTRLYIDEWGVYVRLWLDSEDEYARTSGAATDLAALRADPDGDPTAGRGEAWTAFYAGIWSGDHGDLSSVSFVPASPADPGYTSTYAFDVIQGKGICG